ANSDGAVCPGPKRRRRDALRAGGGHVLTPLCARVSARQKHARCTSPIPSLPRIQATPLSCHAQTELSTYS
ncbi:hypothetical protein ABG768_010537, partial [Culter alburnus]